MSVTHQQNTKSVQKNNGGHQKVSESLTSLKSTDKQADSSSGTPEQQRMVSLSYGDTSIYPASDTASLVGTRQAQLLNAGTLSPVTLNAGAFNVGKSSLQAKLTINTPGDRYEQEADRVASEVVNMSDFEGIGISDSPKATSVIRRRETQSSKSNMHSPGSVGKVLNSHGQPLGASERNFMEPRFGRSFEQVKIHNDAAAHASAREINAHAYTVGNRIVFGKGAYSPNSRSGKELLAHELTHVIQQDSSAANNTVQRRNIFQEIGGLFAGDKFEDSTLQTYLDFLRNEDKIEDFTDSDNKARAIVARWKTGTSPFILSARLKILLIQEMQSGFTGNDDENAILELLWRSRNSDLRTIFLTISASDLNADFQGQEWKELKIFYSTRFKGGMSSLLARTINPVGRPFRSGDEITGLTGPTSEQEDQVAEAINTEARTSTGAVPTFKRKISGKDDWEIRVTDKITSLITSMHTRMVAGRPPRIAANMLQDTDINQVAGEAQRETDEYYGGYYGTKPAFEVGVNIFDGYKYRDDLINASESNADRSANFRVLKLLNGHNDIKAINDEHGAIYTRAEEWALIAPILGFPVDTPLTEAINRRSPPHVTTGIVGNRRVELLDIHRNWGAFAGDGKVYMDRMKAATDAQNRRKLHRLFRTMMHEYVHTLEHPKHEEYRKSLGDQKGGFVLREGMTEFLSRKAWDQVNYTIPLRKKIEGSFHDSHNPETQSVDFLKTYGYDEQANAEAMARIVGIDNVKAAFFLGRVDLIGG